MYKIIFTPESEKNLAKLKKSDPLSFKKAVKLIDELVDHPYNRNRKTGAVVGR